MDNSDILLKTTVIDAKNNKQETFANGSGLTMKSLQYKHIDPDTVLTTLFEYDDVNQLKKVTDDAGKTTESFYDWAGNRTQVKHPASGTTTFGYDPAGNTLWKYTANKDSILYGYEYNRLRTISYPRHPENNVVYTYGLAQNTDNRAGRLVGIEDGSGAQEFKYGRQGEVTEVRRTLVIPNQGVASYVTKTEYDSWNRLLKMIYPDGEVVNYSYNTGGLLAGVSSNATIYVKNILYDKFEQRTQLQYGNGNGGFGAVTTYSYKPTNRQLDQLSVASKGTTIMQNAYLYDEVGNITQIENTGTAVSANKTISGKIGGKMKHSYQYDNLYRLKEAHGVYSDGVVDKSAGYDLYMAYDNMHNIISKKQHISQTGIQFADTLNAGYELNYTINTDNSQQIANIADESYRYEGTKQETPPAAAVVKKSQVYSYDANGNMTYVASGKLLNDSTLQATSTRKLLWDEENRLLAISDNGYVSNYWYDAAGERTVKQSGGSEGVFVNGVLSGARTGTNRFTAYISPYMVVSNGGNYTKHIYMGSQRITSKVSNSGIFTSRNPLTDTTALNKSYTAKLASLTEKIKERFDSLGVIYNGSPQTGSLVSSNPDTTASLYFYHPDHLGSSSLITDGTGALVQHIEYVPFGETFIDERNGNWSTPFLFNGKEKDEETGLHYYGARYYDSRLGVWLSVDPLAEKYINLSSYVFCHNNPSNRIDPDGKGDFPYIYWLGGPYVDMSNAPIITSTVKGFPRNFDYFWNEMLSKNPEMFSPLNIENIKNGRAPIIDDEWINSNPMHAKFRDGKLVHHHVDQGRFGVALPEEVHQKSTALLHTSKSKKFNPKMRVGGKFRTGVNGVSMFFNFIPLILDTPNSPIYIFLQPGEGTQNKAYIHFGTGTVYEWSILGDERTREVRYYEDYQKINGEWRGVNLIRSEYYDINGKIINNN